MQLTLALTAMTALLVCVSIVWRVLMRWQGHASHDDTDGTILIALFIPKAYQVWLLLNLLLGWHTWADIEPDMLTTLSFAYLIIAIYFFNGSLTHALDTILHKFSLRHHA